MRKRDTFEGVGGLEEEAGLLECFQLVGREVTGKWDGKANQGEEAVYQGILIDSSSQLNKSVTSWE